MNKHACQDAGLGDIANVIDVEVKVARARLWTVRGRNGILVNFRGPRRRSTAVSTRKINHGNSEGGRGGVWVDGVGDRAGVRGGGIHNGGAGSEPRDCGEGIEGD